MIFIDSDFIIDFLKGKENTKEFIENYNGQVCTSQINVFEIFFGIFQKSKTDEKEINFAEDFFDSITVFPFDEKCGRISAKIFSSLIKEGKTIDQNDCFIGAIMLKNRIDNIVTGNTKHFSRIKGIKAVAY